MIPVVWKDVTSAQFASMVTKMESRMPPCKYDASDDDHLEARETALQHGPYNILRVDANDRMVTAAALTNVDELGAMMGITKTDPVSYFLKPLGEDTGLYCYFQDDDNVLPSVAACSFALDDDVGMTRAMPGVCFVLAGRALSEKSRDDVLSSMLRGEAEGLMELVPAEMTDAVAEWVRESVRWVHRSDLLKFQADRIDAAAASIGVAPGARAQIIGDTSVSKKKVVQCAATSCSAEGSGNKVCARCRGVSYCSKTCQTAHWPVHKATCVPRQK
jgi:hypothetical protein